MQQHSDGDSVAQDIVSLFPHNLSLGPHQQVFGDIVKQTK